MNSPPSPSSRKPACTADLQTALSSTYIIEPITDPVSIAPHPLGHSTLKFLPVGPTNTLSSPAVSQVISIPDPSTSYNSPPLPSSGRPSSTVAPGP